MPDLYFMPVSLLGLGARLTKTFPKIRKGLNFVLANKTQGEGVPCQAP
jgi:hypothetical protein